MALSIWFVWFLFLGLFEYILICVLITHKVIEDKYLKKTDCFLFLETNYLARCSQFSHMGPSHYIVKTVDKKTEKTTKMASTISAPAGH